MRWAIRDSFLLLQYLFSFFFFCFKDKLPKVLVTNSSKLFAARFAIPQWQQAQLRRLPSWNLIIKIVIFRWHHLNYFIKNQEWGWDLHCCKAYHETLAAAAASHDLIKFQDSCCKEKEDKGQTNFYQKCSPSSISGSLKYHLQGKAN